MEQVCGYTGLKEVHKDLSKEQGNKEKYFDVYKPDVALLSAYY